MTFGRLLRSAFRAVVISAAALVSVGFLVGFFARFGDGPMGPLPGGPLRDGDLVSAEGVDWSFVNPVREIELQLLNPARSRTTWVVVHGGQLYVPCGFVQVPFFKRWHEEAMRDGRAVVRIQGRRYPVRLVRVTDPTIYQRVAERLVRKYPGPFPEPDEVWIFRLDPREER